jgi:predicted transcriptional regulator
LSTGKKKIKIELEDDDGGKYNLSLEGNLSKDKIQKVLQLVETLNISKEEFNVQTKPNPMNNVMKNFNNNNNNNNNSLHSIESKIWSLIENNFVYSSFTSSDIVDSYQSVYNEQLQLSLISTYLSRYVEKNKLMRSKRGKEWVYKLIKLSKSVNQNLNSRDIESQSTHLLNSQFSSDIPNDNYFLKQNVLSTVYDLRL